MIWMPIQIKSDTNPEINTISIYLFQTKTIKLLITSHV